MSLEYAYGMWLVVALNVGLILFFIVSFLTPKGRLEWRGLGVLSAFLIALFSEMYGFPLTIYLLSGWLGDAYPATQPFSHKFGHLWVVVFGGSNWAWGAVMGASLAPVLLVAYRRLALTEEGSMRQEFGAEYARYAAKTPRFFPPLEHWKAFLTAPEGKPVEMKQA